MKIDGSGYGSLAQQAIQQRAQELRNERPVTPQGTVEGIGTSDAFTPSAPDAVEGPSFADILKNTAMAASDKDREAGEKMKALADGKSDDLHGTMITMKEADISIKLVGTVRDRLMDAFHELWRINV